MRVSEFLRTVKAEGWSVRKLPGNHLELSHPDADVPVICGGNAGDPRAIKNTIAEMRRALRADAAPASTTGNGAEQKKPKRKPAPKRDKPALRIAIAPIKYRDTPVTTRPEPQPYDPELRREPMPGAPVGYASTRWR